ncbi:MAG: potassium transporter TrkG, partial [Bacteroidota bacterium]|nr:potassium transporter TrkG [Bacteroidota bacterium]
MRFKSYLFLISLITTVVGVSYLLCMPFAIYYHEPLEPFYIPALIVLFSSLLFYALSTKKFGVIKSNRERVFLIALSLFVLILTSMLPYLVSKTIPSLVDVFFETVSGITSTGSSIIPNVEDFPKSILIWRSFTHWIGGLATIIGLFTILSSLNIGGYNLFSIKEKTAPKLRSMVMSVVMIYCALTFAQVLLLSLGGMNFFESLCHSFGTVSTGSFSPKNNSISGYSPYLQYIMALFIFLSGFSYVIYYLVITGKLKKALIMEENRIYFIVVATISVLITGILYFNVGKVFGTAFRESVFQVVSFVTSSGYYTTNYLKWPSHILPLVYLLIFVGGSTGSASGGIK